MHSKHQIPSRKATECNGERTDLRGCALPNVAAHLVRGVLLAGGSGSRLWPSTIATNKHLLAIFDKPMVYYPLSTLFAAGVREVTVVTSPRQEHNFRDLLGDGSKFGAVIRYQPQDAPRGLVHALLQAHKFISDHQVALILGDNLFHGTGLGRHLQTYANPDRAHVFAYRVADPSAYGVVTLDSSGQAQTIREKPADRRSHLAVTGLYFYPRDVAELAKEVTPSARGEYEITSLNELYLDAKRLDVSVLPRGTTWLDAGTAKDLQRASEFVSIVEERQGIKIGCPEEVAWRNGWLSDAELLAAFQKNTGTEYEQYLAKLVAEESGERPTDAGPAALS